MRRDLFFKNAKGEMIKINDYQAICHDTKDQLLNIPKMQYTTLQLDTIKNLIQEIRANTTIESIMNVDNKRFVFNLAIDNAIQEVQKDDPHKLRLAIVSSHD